MNSPDPDSRVPDEDLDGREPLHERLREVLAVPDAADGHLRRHVIAPEMILSNSSILPWVQFNSHLEFRVQIWYKLWDKYRSQFSFAAGNRPRPAAISAGNRKLRPVIST